MKYSLAFGILSIATALISLHVPPAKAVPNNPQSFEQWCIPTNVFLTRLFHCHLISPIANETLAAYVKRIRSTDF